MPVINLDFVCRVVRTGGSHGRQLVRSTHSPACESLACVRVASDCAHYYLLLKPAGLERFFLATGTVVDQPFEGELPFPEPVSPEKISELVAVVACSCVRATACLWSCGVVRSYGTRRPVVMPPLPPSLIGIQSQDTPTLNTANASSLVGLMTRAVPRDYGRWAGRADGLGRLAGADF